MTERAAIRILVVDDHPMVREGLCGLLQRASDLSVCGVAASAAEALAATAELDPDLIVLDLSLGDADGTSLIREIVRRFPRPRILVLSMYEEAAYAERCLRAGARGYLNKRAAADDVRRAIRVVADGGQFLSEAARARQACDSLPGRRAGSSELGPEALSDRELEVFQLLGLGHRPSRIAKTLNVSVKTVEGYEARIKSKLDLASADELYRFAVGWYRGRGA